MNINPKYVSFQWQTYTMYTWSIENTELNSIPNVLETTVSIIMIMCWWWFFLLALLFAWVWVKVAKSLPDNTNTDDTTK